MRVTWDARASERCAEGIAGVFLVIAIWFGGGSRGAGDFIVQLAALPVLVLGAVRWRHADASRLQRWFLYWLVAAAALIALQLLPLPIALYSTLPQRGQIVADLHAGGLDPAWLPMTLDRWGTVRALLSLLVFAAMWLLANTLPAATHARLARVAVLAALPLVLLGFAQAAAGHEPTLRFYAFHNEFGATATFANRNHFATLLAMLLPFAILFGHQAQTQRQPGAMLLWYGSAVLLLLAAALTFSRAGVIVATLASGAAGLLVLRRVSTADGGSRSRGALVIVGVIGLIAVANYAWSGIVDRFDQDPLSDLRWQYLQHGLDVARAYLPWGSGLGSFRDAYAPFEPLSAMVQVYALHAHDDVLELLIEAGVLGFALLLGFAALFIWMLGKSLMAGAKAPVLSSAAAIVVLVPLAHSTVDYPLRTLAVLVVASLAIAALSAHVRTTFENRNTHAFA
jgi:O-antigen ligase